jgi:hypothetical protein
MEGEREGEGEVEVERGREFEVFDVSYAISYIIITVSMAFLFRSSYFIANTIH